MFWGQCFPPEMKSGVLLDVAEAKTHKTDEQCSIKKNDEQVSINVNFNALKFDPESCILNSIKR